MVYWRGGGGVVEGRIVVCGGVCGVVCCVVVEGRGRCSRGGRVVCGSFGGGVIEGGGCWVVVVWVVWWRGECCSIAVRRLVWWQKGKSMVW